MKKFKFAGILILLLTHLALSFSARAVETNPLFNEDNFFKFLSKLKSFKDKTYGFNIDFNNIPGLVIDGKKLSLTLDVFKLDVQYIRQMSKVRGDLYITTFPSWISNIAEVDAFVQEKIGIEKGVIVKIIPMGYTWNGEDGDYHRLRASPLGIALFQFRDGEWEDGYYYLINGATLSYDGHKSIWGRHDVSLNWALELATMPFSEKQSIQSSAYVDISVKLTDSTRLFIDNRFHFVKQFNNPDGDNQSIQPLGFDFRTLFGLGSSF